MWLLHSSAVSNAHFSSRRCAVVSHDCRPCIALANSTRRTTWRDRESLFSRAAAEDTWCAGRLDTVSGPSSPSRRIREEWSPADSTRDSKERWEQLDLFVVIVYNKLGWEVNGGMEQKFHQNEQKYPPNSR